MEAPANRLVRGAAKFAKLTEADLPEAWRNGVPFENEARIYAARQMGRSPEQVEPIVVVELPDFPWAWKYQQWSQGETLADALPVMVVPNAEFRGLEAQASHLASVECLRSILVTGKPAPFFCRVFLPCQPPHLPPLH